MGIALHHHFSISTYRWILHGKPWGTLIYGNPFRNPLIMINLILTITNHGSGNDISRKLPVFSPTSPVPSSSAARTCQNDLRGVHSDVADLQASNGGAVKGGHVIGKIHL